MIISDKLIRLFGCEDGINAINIFKILGLDKYDKYEKKILASKIEINEIFETLDDVEGLEEEKQVLNDSIIHPFINNKIPVKSLLLYGPPGSGKTFLSKVTFKEIASKAKVTFINLSASTVLEKNLGESVKLVSSAFSLVKKLKKTVLFMDEVDSIFCKTKNALDPYTATLKAEFYSNWDGLIMDNASCITIFACSNKPHLIDECALRRFNTKLFISTPHKNSRMHIIRKRIHRMKNTDDDTFHFFLNKLSEMSEDFTVSDLKYLIMKINDNLINSTSNPLSVFYEEIKNIKNEKFNNSNFHLKRIQYSNGFKNIYLNDEEELLFNCVIHSNYDRICFSDIGGLENIKQSLKNILYNVLNAKNSMNNIHGPSQHGILLFGIPGSGKTMLSKAMVTQFRDQFSFLFLKRNHLNYEEFGKSEKMVSAIFTLAQKMEPSIIVVDSAQNFLFREKKNAFSADFKQKMIKNAFLQSWENLQSDDDCHVIVLAITNRPEDMDESALQRFFYKLEVGVPSKEERKEIVRILFEGSASNDFIQSLVDKTDDWNGRELCNLRDKVVMQDGNCDLQIAFQATEEMNAIKKRIHA